MRILLIGDGERATTAVAMRLRKATFAVDAIADLAGAEEQAGVVAYDAIVLRVARGLELCRRLRSDGIAAPILILARGSSASERVACLDAGADDCVVDGVPPEELLARIRALLRRGTATRNTVLRVDDLTLDVASRDARRGGRPLRLTAKEQAILELLMRRAGELVTRLELGEHVWAAERDNLTNLVDVHISNLRRKVDREATTPLIRTVRGMGFRLGPASDGETRRGTGSMLHPPLRAEDAP